VEPLDRGKNEGRHFRVVVKRWNGEPKKSWVRCKKIRDILQTCKEKKAGRELGGRKKGVARALFNLEERKGEPVDMQKGGGCSKGARSTNDEG